MYSPSIYAHTLSGGLLMISILYIVYCFRRVTDTYRFAILLLVLSIAMGVHGISHAVLESVYNYNPLTVLGLVEK